MFIEEINHCFNKHIKLIVDIINAECPKNIISIFLYGGYGRDEGSWVVKNIDNVVTVSPYNDYDIALIVKNKVTLEQIKELEALLKEFIDIKWIDIAQYTSEDLKNLKPYIKNYDLKYASKFLYGNINQLDLIPSIEAEKLPLKDIDILFFTRLWTLIGSFDRDGLKTMNPESEMFFRNQMAKGILAIVDCVLLQNSAYDSSYRNRVKYLPNYNKDENLITLSKWALEEKLFPKSENMTSEQILTLYMNVNNMFYKYFFNGLSKSWKKNITSIEDIKKHMLYSPNNFTKRMISNFILRKKMRDKDIILAVLQCYIAYIYIHPNKKSIIYIQDQLNKYFNVRLDDLDEIRIFISEKRLGI